MCHSSKPQADVASSVRTSAAGGASACTSCEKVRIARHEFLAATNLWPPHRTQSGNKYVSTWPQNCSHVGGMTVTPDQNLRAIRAHMSPQDYDWWLRIVDFIYWANTHEYLKKSLATVPLHFTCQRLRGGLMPTDL